MPKIHVVHVHDHAEPPKVIGFCLFKSGKGVALYRGKKRKWSTTIPADYFATEKEAQAKA